MKKFLIIGLMLFSVIFFLSEEEEKEEHLEVSKVNVRPSKQNDDIVINYDEIEVYIEENVSITKGVHIDVLRENNVTINAKIIDEDKSEETQYIWFLDGKEVGSDISLERSFFLGKHIVSASIYSARNLLLKQEIIDVVAWNYRKERRNYYNEESGELDEFYENIYDYHENLMLSLSQETRTEYFYNEEGLRIEERVENYEYPENSKHMLYTYYDNGNENTIEEFDYEGSFVSREIYVYDENGTLSDFKYEYPQAEKEEVERENVESDEGNYTYVDEEESEKEEENKDIYKEDEEGRIVYQKVMYDDETYIDEYIYNKDGYLVEEISTFLSKDTYKVNKETFEYNSNGRRREYKEYKMVNEIVTCEAVTTFSYNSDGMQKSTIKEVLDGVCGYEEMEVGKKELRYFYDKDGNIIEKRVVHYNGDDAVESNSQLTVETSYLNDLD